MLFNSITFISLFFPISLIFLKIFNLKKEYQYDFILICFSIFFYSFNEHSITLILLISIFINFFFYKYSEKFNILFPIILNFGILVYFKYVNDITNIVSIFFERELFSKNITLPLAISFFSIQQIIFHIDMNSFKIPKVKFSKYFLFIIFFPQLIAGPIMYYSEFAKQSKFMMTRFYNRFSFNFYVGFSIFALGLFKKIIIADNLGNIVDAIYFNIESDYFTLIDCWIFVLSYSAQIYFDFSAYSDMAIGLAKIFGLNLPINFYSPYKSNTLANFWKTWHITLSRIIHLFIFNNLVMIFFRWLKKIDNFVIFLIPVVLAMSISGLWHGSSLNFILWGLYHGIFLFLFSYFRLNDIFEKRLIGIILTFSIVSFSWILFRSSNLDTALNIYSKIFNIREYIDIFDQNYIFFKAILLHTMFSKIYLCLLILVSYSIIFIFPNISQIYSLRYIDQFTIPLTKKIKIKSKILNSIFPLFIGLFFSITIFIMFINTNEKEFIYFRF
jgi:alginate O-acetyltransferase complex protein AlgI